MFNFDKALDDKLNEKQKEQDLLEEYQEWFENYIEENNILDDDIADIEEEFWTDPEMFIKEVNYEL
jgi:uncharacterized protein YaiL (DUF2058 family)